MSIARDPYDRHQARGTRGKHVVQHWTRLDQENRETLHAYAAFIGEDAEYVLNQVIDRVLGRDKDSASGGRSTKTRTSSTRSGRNAPDTWTCQR